MEECSELLQSVKVRLFGNRSSKVRCSRAESTRKLLIDVDNGLLENLTVSKNDQREIDNFKGHYRSFNSFTIFCFKLKRKLNTHLFPL